MQGAQIEWGGAGARPAPGRFAQKSPNSEHPWPAPDITSWQHQRNSITSSKFTTSFTVLQHSLQLLLHQVWHSRREATVKRLFYNIADEATIYPLNQRAKMGRYGGDFLTKLRGTAPFRPAPRPLILIKRGRSLTKLRSSAPRPSSAPSRGNMPFLKTLL